MSKVLKFVQLSLFLPQKKKPALGRTGSVPRTVTSKVDELNDC